MMLHQPSIVCNREVIDPKNRILEVRVIDLMRENEVASVGALTRNEGAVHEDDCGSFDLLGSSGGTLKYVGHLVERVHPRRQVPE